MLTAKTTTAGLFWQWGNQSYNVVVNYCNGNKSNPQPWSAVAQSYCGAVGVSFACVLGLNKVLDSAKSFSPAVLLCVFLFF